MPASTVDPAPTRWATDVAVRVLPGAALDDPCDRWALAPSPQREDRTAAIARRIFD